MREIVRTSPLVADGRRQLSELTLAVGRRPGRLYRNVTIGERQDERAVRVTDYWGEPTSPPQWRRSLTDRLDMPGDGTWPDADHLAHHELKEPVRVPSTRANERGMGRGGIN